MTINLLSITASDQEMSYGGGLLRIAPAGMPLPPDVLTNLGSYDVLWCWPVAMDGNVPRRLICGGPFGNLCQMCTTANCPKGPPPPMYAPMPPPPPPVTWDVDASTNRLMIPRPQVTYGLAEVHFTPFDDSLFTPGPVCVLDLGGPVTALDVTQVPVWSWLQNDAAAGIVVHVYNVVDPKAYQEPPGAPLHALHNKVVAIPAIPWTPPPASP